MKRPLFITIDFNIATILPKKQSILCSRLEFNDFFNVHLDVSHIKRQKYIIDSFRYEYLEGVRRIWLGRYGFKVLMTGIGETPYIRISGV